ncbi:methyltransferase family protein [Polycladidibacter stylochi]|uniref:methyltransferase family protein n=1 Tax=Polycladidibacter stylochi TaxID=1807766 RepID=UPI0008359542|nr:isoprenylcysteine carboxylmethyltransferase family protein [Pseudovibrio stylochi]
MNHLELKIPPVFVFAFSLLALVVHDAFLAHNGLLRLLPAWVLYSIIAALCAFAVYLAVSSLSGMRAGGTSVSPRQPQKASKLVIHGAFKFCRNPMYLCLVVVVSVLALLAGHVQLLIWPLFLALYLTRFQIIPEERILTALFGKEYMDYKRRTRRWF